MVRVNMDINCKWYRDFCSKHPSKRGVRRGKFDTIIRRANVVNALKRMTSGSSSFSPYAPDFLKIAEKMAP